MPVEATARGKSTIDRARIAELTEREQAKLAERTPASKQRFERGVKVMPGGVPSSFQENDPWPVYLERCDGARVWDVDGHEYVDFHNGFGVMCIGHSNPTVGAAVKARIDLGTHFAAPTDGSIVVAEELADRFGLPQWRFTHTRPGAKKGAVHPPPGAPDPYGEGYPRALTELTRSVPFNDADALESVLRKLDGQVAGLIMEPAMMNINIIPPAEGYLQRVRELTREHGVKLIFDEVKTGATIGRGGATERFGVQPDMITLAKATCGGYPGGSIGMTAELAEQISGGRVHQYGTFNGNPLVMAAAQATLTEVLTEAAYAKLENSNRWLLDACNAVIERYDLPCYSEGLGAKGCVIFSPEPIHEYRDYLTKVDGELSTLAWLYHMNNGVFMTPGVEEEWTLSIAHTDEHIDRYVAAFEAFAGDVTAG